MANIEYRAKPDIKKITNCSKQLKMKTKIR